ncbi:hypothetical protein FOB58_002913 [Candida parapsilosis]|uniref:Uncharacterized protein n=1 Tax=Candida parapsilosis TaxID=5480 RepID=A0A8X7NNL6_CANPA|nr:hypothetical protein FOB59_003440 [Candida parapsilosis]KAF6048418.1 hypothetical protein FOB59_003460 [Candida parapsilosis]KAF6049626.1 hypothetical protein FOB58_002903 [Candida parapsilosis]KAF6049636.1 hypothetical protein FOB58_002913 [Candida parapsilosis]KAF6057477.1 hypothetical protein FOB60_002032 [Candida parapsilosis]
MDSFIKKGQDFVKSGKVTQEDGKDAYQDFSKGGNFQDNAKKAYSDYQENHKDDKKSESKEASNGSLLRNLEQYRAKTLHVSLFGASSVPACKLLRFQNNHSNPPF